jgi:hypothetical protein
MTQDKGYSKDAIVKLCTPNPDDENDLNWMSNFAIYISVVTGKHSPYSTTPCAETALTKVFKDYAFASEPYTFKPIAKSSFDELYSVWKELTVSNKDMFEEYLAGNVPVMGDDFGKKKKEKPETKCEDFYKPIISAFKTRDAELEASQHLALEFKKFTDIVVAQARDADETRAADQAIDDALAEMEYAYAMRAMTPLQPMNKNTPSAADIMNNAQKEYWENKKAKGEGGSSRKYLRRRFKKSKSRSKKSKPKSKSKPTLKSNRKSKSKSKSKSKTKRRQKK